MKGWKLLITLLLVATHTCAQDSSVVSIGLGYRAVYTEIAPINKGLDEAIFEEYKQNESGAFSQGASIDATFRLYKRISLGVGIGYAQVNYRSVLFESQLPDAEITQFRYTRKADYFSLYVMANYHFTKHWFAGLGVLGNVNTGSRTIFRNWDADYNVSKDRQDTPFDYESFWTQGQLQVGYENTLGAFRYRIATLCAVGFGAWTKNEFMDYQTSQFGIHLSFQRKL